MKHRLLGNLAIAVAASCLVAPLSASAAPFDKIEKQSTLSLSNFQKVYIAPVTVALDEENVRRSVRDIRSDRPVRQRDQELKAEDTYDDLVQAFERKNFTLVDAPGADVLTVSTTITGMDSSRPSLADYDTSINLSFNSVYAGGGEFMTQLSQGDTILASITDEQTTSLNDGRPRIGVWQDFDRVSARFARKLAKYAQSN